MTNAAPEIRMAFDSFDYHLPSQEQLTHIEEIRRHAKALRSVFDAMPGSREKSLALTNLEQALMWGNKAAVLPPPTRPPPG